MSDSATATTITGILEAQDLQVLLDRLLESGYRVLGPVVSDDTVVLDELTTAGSLPVGWVDEQSPGRYRNRRNGVAFFDHLVGPQNWKRFLFPADQRLWSADRNRRGGIKIEEEPAPEEKLALVGVRSCDLAALDILDRVFAGDGFQDARYMARREQSFIVAVNCRRSAPTCFCTSMGTGPEVRSGFDLCLTELISDNRHVFFVEIGSDSGKAVAAQIPLQETTQNDIDAVQKTMELTSESIERALDVSDVQELLRAHLEGDTWEDIANRCLACANCTLVCPTCFCTTVEDVTDLSGNHAERIQKWDSCFTNDFSYIHGGSVRTSIKSRYRQWLTHKLASWVEQYGTMGCVGCGRCITWCPVGIDLTEEIPRIREAHAAQVAATASAESRTR